MLPISLKKQSRGTNSAAIAPPTRIIGFNLCETPPGPTAGSGFHLHVSPRASPSVGFYAGSFGGPVSEVAAAQLLKAVVAMELIVWHDLHSVRVLCITEGFNPDVIASIPSIGADSRRIQRSTEAALSGPPTPPLD